MVRIQKVVGDGTRELTVSTAAYNNFYKGAGWQKIGVVSTVAAKSEEEDEWDGFEEADEEPSKPLSEMTRYELEAYAAKLGVDLTGLSSNKQYREAIKAAIV